MADSWPDVYSIADQTDLNPKGRYHVEFDVKGFDDPNLEISVDTSLDAYFERREYNASVRSYVTIKSKSYTTSRAHTAKLTFHAPSDYRKYVKVTVSAGYRVRSFYAKTKYYPDVQQIIESNFPDNVSLRDVGDFFGYYGSYPNLSEYTRGGGHIPDIYDNRHIPSSGNVKLSDLRTAKSALYFTYKPPDKSNDIWATKKRSENFRLTWDVEKEYGLGFGRYAEAAEYKYDLQVTSGDKGSISLRRGSDQWDQNGGLVQIEAWSSRYQTREWKGKLTIYARSRIYPSRVIHHTVDWTMIALLVNEKDEIEFG